MASTPSTSRDLQRGGGSVGLLNQLRERPLASVEDPNTTPAISSGALKEAARRRLGRDNSGHAGLGYTVSHKAIVSLGGDGRAAGCSGPR